MTQKIYALVCDGQDGSASITWFKDSDIALSLIDPTGDNWRDEFNLNSGFAEILEFPDSVNLEACGFYFSDAEYAPSGPSGLEP